MDEINSTNEQKIYFENKKGDKLCGILCNPINSTSAPLFILCHGHGSHKNSKTNLRLKDGFAKHGIASFRIDFYGHGESGGKFEDATPSEAIDDVKQAIKFVRQKGFTKIGLMGSSYGGFACLLAASKDPQISALILKSPALDYSNWKQGMVSGDFGKSWKKNGYTTYNTSDGKTIKLAYSFIEHFAIDGARYNTFNAAKLIQSPTLIVHGDADTDAPVNLSRKIATLLPDCQLAIIHGANHQYTNEEDFEAMAQTITNFAINIK